MSFFIKDTEIKIGFLFAASVAAPLCFGSSAGKTAAIGTNAATKVPRAIAGIIAIQ